MPDFLDFDKAVSDSVKAREIYESLKATDNMCEVADTIDGLDETTLRWVLKMFVYDR